MHEPRYHINIFFKKVEDEAPGNFNQFAGTR